MIEKYLDLDEIRGLQHQFDWANVFTFLGQVTLQANALEDNSLEGILPAKIGMPLLATVMLVPLVYAIYSNPSSMTRREDVKLVKTGAYGRVRHPIYATIRGASIGISLIAPTPEVIIYGAAVFGTTELLARSEEWELQKLFPDEYQNYKEEVPGWIPYSNQLKGYVKKALEKVKDAI